MVYIYMNDGRTINTRDGDLSFWAQRMSTTDIQLIKDSITGYNVAINPKYIEAVAETND